MNLNALESSMIMDPQNPFYKLPNEIIEKILIEVIHNDTVNNDKKIYTLRLVSKTFNNFIENSDSLNFYINKKINFENFDLCRDSIKNLSLGLINRNNINFAITIVKCMNYFKGSIPLYSNNYHTYAIGINQEFMISDFLKIYLRNPKCTINNIEKLLNLIDESSLINFAYLSIVLHIPCSKIANDYLSKITNEQYHAIGQMACNIRKILKNDYKKYFDRQLEEFEKESKPKTEFISFISMQKSIIQLCNKRQFSEALKNLIILSNDQFLT